MSEARRWAIQLLMVLIGFGLTVVIAGCARAPVEKVVTVQVKVKEPCIDRAPVRPVYQTGQGEYPGEKAAAKILADDFERAEGYGTAWEAAAAGCLVVPAAKP